MKWAYGITTVPARFDTFLPRTIESLCRAGFGEPRLFVDGADDPVPFWKWPVAVTMRSTPVGSWSNWYLGLAELYARDPDADRFVMFEDDIVAVGNLRGYLESVETPVNGYCNLCSAGMRNWLLGRGKRGWYESDQRGFGAQALMFDQAGVIDLLASSSLFVRHRLDPKRGSWNVDGAIITALRGSAMKPPRLEYCHNPPLVQHVCVNNSLIDTGGAKRNIVPVVAVNFPGEQFDARSLIKGKEVA